MAAPLSEKGVELERTLGFFQFNRDVDDEEVSTLRLCFYEIKLGVWHVKTRKLKIWCQLAVFSVTFKAWIKEKEPLLQSTNYGNNLFEVQKLQKKLQVM